MNLIYRACGWQPLRRLAARSSSLPRQSASSFQITPLSYYLNLSPRSVAPSVHYQLQLPVRGLTSASNDLDIKDDDASKNKPSKDNLLTVPNALCVSRIVMSPYLAHLIIEGDYKWALGLFAYAGITDVVRAYPCI